MKKFFIKIDSKRDVSDSINTIATIAVLIVAGALIAIAVQVVFKFFGA